VKIEKGELVEEKKTRTKIHLLGPCWELQTTSLIVFIFGVLVNIGKKIMYLNEGVKVIVS